MKSLANKKSLLLVGLVGLFFFATASRAENPFGPSPVGPGIQNPAIGNPAITGGAPAYGYSGVGYPGAGYPATGYPGVGYNAGYAVGGHASFVGGAAAGGYGYGSGYRAGGFAFNFNFAAQACVRCACYTGCGGIGHIRRPWAVYGGFVKIKQKLVVRGGGCGFGCGGGFFKQKTKIKYYI